MTDRTALEQAAQAAVEAEKRRNTGLSRLMGPAPEMLAVPASTILALLAELREAQQEVGRLKGELQKERDEAERVHRASLNSMSTADAMNGRHW